MLGLAFKFIKYDRAKSIGIVTAIVISIFLIGQQLSLLFFLMGLMGNLVGNAPVTDKQLWIIESQSTNINAVNVIDNRLVQQIASLPGVESTFPVVLAAGQASFLDGKTAGITLVGANSPQFVMGPVPEKIEEGHIADLVQPSSVTAELYNAKTWKTDLFLNKPIEINGKSAKIAVITKNAQAFGASLMYTSMENAIVLGNASPSKVSIIIANITDSASKQQVQQDIEQLFPQLKAWDAKKLKNSTIKEILISSNMGMSFGTLVIFAMISGFFIIGLTLYSSALDRIKDYGTLKAIGATRGYVNKLIIAQAFLYAIIGYTIAMLLLYGFKFGVANSGLAIDISVGFALFLLFVTLLISVGGSLFAVRKIAKLEPASVF
ncbi:putative ABC transport system permease protein [Sphingobacterium alimentarium]|uniref:Putative ABC transport system permease protein n=1 Tax=Sphingobacterium alimentarium TaxID=797292 RepID=A0A4R3VR87_9SPHI|nr:ABC transporter permease [Sphingobacterium alimentarium]TCV10252.1 putative ABC transport system permease protein [Sphingobacterium alimentarium]